MPAEPDNPATQVVVRVGALVGRPVVDEHGEPYGHVIDLRVVQDGPAADGVTAALRVDGLIVGRIGVGERLGLLRHRVHGPWLLTSLARVLSHHTHFVPWDAVVSVPPADGDEPVVVTAPSSGSFERIG